MAVDDHEKFPGFREWFDNEVHALNLHEIETGTEQDVARGILKSLETYYSTIIGIDQLPTTEEPHIETT